jgi:hypothetical protein
VPETMRLSAIREFEAGPDVVHEATTFTLETLYTWGAGALATKAVALVDRLLYEAFSNQGIRHVRLEHACGIATVRISISGAFAPDVLVHSVRPMLDRLSTAWEAEHHPWAHIAFDLALPPGVHPTDPGALGDV